MALLLRWTTAGSKTDRFRSVLILSSVCTSSVWNPVKRIFHGFACDVGRYPWLSRHNQASTTMTTTSTSSTPRQEHLDSLGASSPSTSLRPSLSRTLCRLLPSLYHRPFYQPGTLLDHQSVCLIPDACLQGVVWTTWKPIVRTTVIVKTRTAVSRMTHPKCLRSDLCRSV